MTGAAICIASALIVALVLSLAWVSWLERHEWSEVYEGDRIKLRVQYAPGTAPWAARDVLRTIASLEHVGCPAMEILVRVQRAVRVPGIRRATGTARRERWLGLWPTELVVEVLDTPPHRGALIHEIVEHLWPHLCGRGWNAGHAERWRELSSRARQGAQP